MTSSPPEIERDTACGFAPATRPRINPSFAVLATVLMMGSAIAIPAYRTGKHCESQRQFFPTYRLPAQHEAFASYSLDYARDSAEPNDVLFFGESTLMTGVDVKQFTQLTGLSAYNLGTAGALGFDGFELILRRYLEHHPPPRLVVLGLQPCDLGPPPQRRKQTYAGAPGAITISQMFLWAYGDEGEYPPPIYPRPIMHAVTEGLRTWLGDLLGGQEHYLNTMSLDLGSRSYNRLKRDIAASRGFISLIAGNPPLPSGDRRNLATGFYLPAVGATDRDPFPVSPAVDETIRGIAQMLAARNIRLMIRLTPVLTGAPDEQFDSIEAFCDRLQRECPNVVCAQPAVLQMPPDCFVDERYHMSFKGIARFTELVAASVGRELGFPSDRPQSGH